MNYSLEQIYAMESIRGRLNPSYLSRYNSVNMAEKYSFLHESFASLLALDGSSVGICTPDSRDPRLISNLSVESMIGYIMEAMLVRWFNYKDSDAGAIAYSWCRNVEGKRTRKEIREEFLAIRTEDPRYKELTGRPHKPNDSDHDIQFLVKDPRTNTWKLALKNGSTSTYGEIAGIQVKSITGDVRRQIVEPFREAKYTHIVSMLFMKNSAGQFTYHTVGEATSIASTEFGYRYPGRFIKDPDYFGIPQFVVNHYYEYITLWHQNEQMRKVADILFDNINS